jgi:hypothetical protein
MKEIVELNRRIRTEAPEIVPKKFGFLMVCRGEDGPGQLKKLPAGISAELDELRQKLDIAIPNDFAYQIILGDDKPDLALEYNDGAQTAANCPVEWDEERSIFDQLKEIDWESERKEVLARCQTFEVMKDAAKDRPSTLPSTKQLQRVFRGDMKAFVKKNRKDAAQVYALMYRKDEIGSDPESGLREESFENMKAFCWALPDLMTVQYWVITVVTGGKPLPVAKIEGLKKQALKELEDMPISHLKALGKM